MTSTRLMNHYNYLLMELDQIPEFLQEFIKNKVIKEWNELTSFMTDKNIPKNK